MKQEAERFTGAKTGNAVGDGQRQRQIYPTENLVTATGVWEGEQAGEPREAACFLEGFLSGG